MNSSLFEWQEVICHICGSIPKETVKLYGEPLTDGQFGYEVHPVVCQCGLVCLSPRWTASTYSSFYEDQYDELYRLEIKPDYGIEGVRSNMAEVWQRSASHLPDTGRVSNILDAGCGSGYGLQYLQEEMPHAKICGIEASPECCRILTEEVGGELLDSDIDGPWLAANQGRFDFIVMRHVVEHFLTPIETLSRLRGALAPGGLIYIAVPDMMHPRTVLRDYDKWWQYWFRAVHPFYYCKETLLTTLAKAGLSSVAFGEENEEVWCLVEADSGSFDIDVDLHDRQQQLLEKLLP